MHFISRLDNGIQTRGMLFVCALLQSVSEIEREGKDTCSPFGFISTCL